jgi:integrase
MPAGADTVAGYISDLAQSGAKSSTIERRISSLSVAHKRAGQANPCRAELVREALAGIKRELGTAPHKKTPMRLDDLRAFCHALPDTLTGKRDRALLAVLFAGARRRSEVVAIVRSDVRFTSTGMVITIRKSKTDQDGKGHTIRIPATASDVCAVRLLREWIDASEIVTGPVFRRISRGVVGTEALHDSSVALIIKAAAAGAGLDPKEFSGHSGRSGFVTEAFDNGVPEADIMEVTDHKSQTVMRGYRRATGAEQHRAIAAVMGVR